MKIRKIPRRGRQPMARIVRKWLLLIISIALVTVTLVSWLILGTQARTAAGQLLQDHLTYISSQIDVKLDATDQLKIQASTSLFNKAYSLQQIIRLNPLILHDERGLAEVCRRLELDMLDVTDATGTVTATWPHKTNYVGRVSFSDYDVTRKYLTLILCPNAKILEAPRQNMEVAQTASYYYQFAGVARLDEPGIIQVGQSGVRYEQSLAAASVSGIAPGYTVEKGGFVLIASKNQIVSASDASLAGTDCGALSYLPQDRSGALVRVNCGGVACFAAARQHGDYTVYAFLPRSEAYSSLMTAMHYMTASAALVFLAVFFGLSLAIERSVVSDIRSLSSYVSGVSQGNLDTLLDIRGTAETAALSDGINSMVLSLRRTFDEKERRITSAMEENERIVTEREQFKDKALHDPLTGLYNRAGFTELCARRLQESLQSGAVSALLMMDLDRFKAINDTWGHAAGDAVLAHTAELLRGFFRADDLVGRIGGDEFCIFLSGVSSPELAAGRAQALVELLSRSFEADGVPVCVGCSIGVAFSPVCGVTPDELYRAADAALYRAKSSGRGCFSLADGPAETGAAGAPGHPAHLSG